MSYEKILLFYNPYAGNGIFSNNLDKVVSAFQRKRKLVIPVRADRGNMLDRVLSHVKKNDLSKVVAAGGDGTVNAVVEAMIKYDLDIPIALLPAGTANDLARHFGIPTTFNKMLKIAVDGRCMDIDVGLANGRPFVNVLAAGVVVDASQKTDPIAKNTFGLAAYYLRALMDLPKLHPIPVKLTMPDQVVEADMNAILIMNGRGAGGFRSVAPHAVINDGKLEVMLVHNVPFVNWGPLILNVLTGTTENNKYLSFFSTDALRLESEEDLITDLDGEEGVPLPVDVGILPSRLRLCVPEDYVEHENA
jgi:YegS/Rv2252/BmrU family lipid kinase